MDEEIPLNTFDDKNKDVDDDGDPYNDEPGPSDEREKLIPKDGKKGKGKGKRSKYAETSFTDNTLENPQITFVNLKLEQMYPEYGKNGRFLNLVVDEG